MRGVWISSGITQWEGHFIVQVFEVNGTSFHNLIELDVFARN